MIRASYGEMLSSATSISNASQEYKTNVDALYRIVDNLSNNWKGIDNINFANTVNGYKEDLKSLGDVVDNYAKFLSKAANIINQTQNDISNAAGRL